MRRFLEEKLHQWFENSPRKPLIIRGARQVGKSTLVRQFAKNHQLKLIEINLEEYRELDSAFKTNKLDVILAELEVIHGAPIQDQNTLLFLDDIQATPHALASLRFFYEKRPDLAVIAAGSLLEFVLSEHSFSMPVGRVTYLHLGPMSFREFLMAVGEDPLISIMDRFSKTSNIPLVAHQKLLQRQRQYLFIGGMPEAILNFSKSNDFNQAREVHRQIVQTYQDDFSKYATKNQGLRLEKIYRSIPKIIGKKINYSKISREDHSRLIKEAIDLLVKARLLTPAYHSSCSGLPLSAGIQEKIYKLYFVDVGLFNYLCGLEWPMIYRLEERALINEGDIAEQFVAQHLAYKDEGREPPHLYYWLREGKSSNAEVDFVISIMNRIIPIEIKAGKTGALKSLIQMMVQKNLNEAYRFDLNLPSKQKINHKISQSGQTKSANFQLHSLPLYLIETLSGNSQINENTSRIPG